MTSTEFNEKYSAYLEEGHYGLDIDIPEATDFLDKAFQVLIKIPGFKYSQIKSKYNSSRFYTNLRDTLEFVGKHIENSIENELDFYIKAEELIYKRKQNENGRI
jgi:hypothetical protein